MATFGKPSEIRSKRRSAHGTRPSSSMYEMSEGRDQTDRDAGYDNPVMQQHQPWSPRPVQLDPQRRLAEIMTGKNGHYNEAFSVGSSSNLDITADGSSELSLPNHFVYSRSSQVAATDRKNGSTARMKAFAGSMAVLVILILAAAAVVLYLWLATDTFSSKAPTTAMPAEVGTIFMCEIANNRTWSDDLYNISTPYYRNMSTTFVSELSTAFKNISGFNRIQLLNFRPGSVIVVFQVHFNQSYAPLYAKVIIATALSAVRLEIINSSLAVNVASGLTVCGKDFFYCDETCRYKSYRCNGRLECSDWADEADCAGQSVTCSFEAPDRCGYHTESLSPFYEWSPKSGPTGTAGTGPSADHTYGNVTGVYFYTEATCYLCSEGEGARLLSPLFLVLSSSCITFYYHMLGSSGGMGSLSLLLVSADSQHQHEPELLWTRQGNVSDAWVKAAVQLDVKSGEPKVYQLVFDSRYGGNTLGDKAVDDIVLSKGSCLWPGCVPSDRRCKLTDTCIKASQICDGWFDCPDRSDELQCPGFVVSCSFENDSMCELVQGSVSSAAYAWALSYGVSDDSGSGRYFDRTKGNEYGFLAYVDGLHLSVGERSKLLAPQVPPKSPACLQLFHRSTGGALQVTAESTSSGIQKTVLLWKSKTNSTSPWQRLQLSIAPQLQAYTLVFEAVNSGGIVSIDDVTFRVGGLCQATAGMLLCPTGRSIPNEWLCDGQGDCSDSSDEAGCATCPEGKYSCKDRSCVDGGASIVCDGFNDCKDGSDELKPCARLATANGTERLQMYHSASADYYEVCYEKWASSLSNLACSYLGMGYIGQAAPVASAGGAKSYLYVNTSDAIGSSSDQRVFTYRPVPQCPGGSVVRIFCLQDLCGQTATVPVINAPIGAPVAYLIGGDDADRLSHPWQVSIRSSSVGHICGGSLIDSQWVLTAAHCFDSSSASALDAFSVLLGSTSVNPGEDSGSILLGVASIVVHPLYTQAYKGYDATLLLLKRPVEYSDYIRPVCLPRKDTDAFTPRAMCRITGWGLYQTSPRSFPTILQTAKTKIYPTDLCNQTDQSYIGKLSSVLQVCAGYTLGTIRTCQADSGGPLACLNAVGRWELYGITSFGPSTCDGIAYAPDVFTRVPSVVGWVRNTSALVFRCNNGAVRYTGNQLCNGVDDCGDGSDERLLCPSSVSCRFEPPSFSCGWYSDPAGWVMARGSASVSELATNGGPSFDHTSGLPGGRSAFMFAPAKSLSRLIGSSRVTGSSTKCLQFYYHLLGTEPGSLGLQYSLSSMALWNASENHGYDDWIFGQADLPPGNYSIYFSASLQATSSGGIGLDDIFLSEGPCPSTLCANSSTFLCADKSTCINAELLCDVVCHCADCSDEATCPQGSPSGIKCNFSEPYNCGMRQSIADDYNWVVDSAPSSTSRTGPSGGHTVPAGNNSLTSDEYYVARAPRAGATAVARWLIHLGNTSAGKMPYCLRFYYYMYGADVGLLQIYTEDGSATTKQWETWGSKGMEWKSALVNISSSFKSVNFVAKSGGPLYNHIAVDDVTLTRGQCATSLPSCSSLRQTPGQPTAASLTSPSWQCPDECIDLTRKCDGIADCQDLSDEDSCSWGSVNKWIACDFENVTSCGYTLYGSGKWSLMSPQSGGLVQNYSGHYISSNLHRGKGNTSAYLLFPSIQVDGSGCVQFDYAFLGVTPDSASLVIDANDFRVHNSVLLWSSTHVAHSATWRHMTVTLPAGLWRVQFEARQGPQQDVAVILDNVNVTSSSCQASFMCPPWMFACAKGLACVGQTSVCNGELDCADGSDEMNCPGSDLDCNFEAGMCGWQSSIAVVQTGGRSSQPTDPPTDNTYGNSSGHFLLLPIATNGDLRSRTYNFSQTHCLTFSYFMGTPSVGALQVSFDNINLLKINGVQGRLWWRARVTVRDTAGSTSALKAVTISAVGGSQSALGSIAIDDIVMRKGDCDCSKGFRCNSSECLEQDLVCDYNVQCLDGSDESPTCPCPAGDMRCANNECFPIDYVCKQPFDSCFLSPHNYTCSCEETYFQCNNGLCIDLATFCNDHFDCEGHEDEFVGCHEVKATTYFKCTENEQWWPKTFLCDGSSQCPDGEDESQCAPASSSPVPALVGSRMTTASSRTSGG